jgi:hypothetical protein
MLSLVYPNLSWHYRHALAVCCVLERLETCAEYTQIILNDAKTSFSTTGATLLYLKYHHFGLGPSLWLIITPFHLTFLSVS